MRRLLALLLLVFVAAAGAQERIVDFAADIAVGGDGTLTVSETIVVQAEGQTIRRGILRDFPTEYRDRAGNRVRVPFDVLAVRRNGAAENYALETLDNGLRIRIGSASVLLPHGRHTYAITYAPRASSASSPITTSCTGMSPATAGPSRSNGPQRG